MTRLHGAGFGVLYKAAARFVDAALRKDGSIFTPGQPVWSPGIIEDLYERLIGHQDTSSSSFDEKLKRQMEGAPQESVQLLGEVLFVVLLTASKDSLSPGAKRSLMQMVLSWSPLPISIPEELDAVFKVGLAKIGSVQIRRFEQMWLVLEFVRLWKGLSKDEQDGALEDPWKFKELIERVHVVYGQPQKAALLHLVYPDTFEPIISHNMKSQIAAHFSDSVTIATNDVDRKLLQIREKLGERFGKDFYFYEERVKSLWQPAPANPWQQFISWAKRFYEWEGFEENERTYKLEVAERLGEVRQALLNGSPEWPDLLKKAFTSRLNNLTPWRMNDTFSKWCKSNPSEAAQALRTLWESDASLSNRIRNFLGQVPKDAYGGMGAVIASFLLMAGDPKQYPMYRSTVLDKGYQLVGYPVAKGGDSADIYEQALAFLDKLMQEAESQGLKLRDRLDAQGLLWCVVRWGPEDEPISTWPSQDQTAFLKYRGDIGEDGYNEVLQKHRPTVWWVNGTLFEREGSEGYLWAANKDTNGRKVATWEALAELEEGDLLIVYEDYQIGIRAIYEVIRTSEPSSPPAELMSTYGTTEGRRLRVKEHQIEDAILIEDVPLDWRTADAGPFDKNGKVKSGYIFPIVDSFLTRFLERFAYRLPVIVREKLGIKQTRLVKIAPGEEARFWEECLAGGYICVGWDDVGDLRQYASKQEFRQRFAELYPYNNSQGVITSKANEVWTLMELKQGDRIVANKGISEICGVGTVQESGYIWRPERTSHKHTVQVQWDTSYAKRIPDQRGWALKTVAEVDSRLAGIILRTPSISEVGDTNGLDGHANYIESDYTTIEGAVRTAMYIDGQTLRRYHVSLKTRGLVILSGISGTGKTMLTSKYATAVGAHYRLVPVAPNWNTNEDLLGYFNPLDNQYYDTDFSRFLREASHEYKRAQSAGHVARPYHLVLDEMNLARVEYYFAKFLSAMEVGTHGGSALIELGPTEQVVLPPNLKFIGTVNIDETTHGFSDKVYDRAQLIELEASREAMEKWVEGTLYRNAILSVWDAVRQVAPFAFRVLTEIRVYLEGAGELNVSWEEALDEQILQKILPKLKGVDRRLENALKLMEELTAGTFPLSHAKVSKMRHGFSEYGLASYF